MGNAIRTAGGRGFSGCYPLGNWAFAPTAALYPVNRESNAKAFPASRRIYAFATMRRTLRNCANWIALLVGNSAGYSINATRGKPKANMTTDNLNILECLETLAAACPWDTCDLWVSRTPEGRYGYTATVNENARFGFRFNCARGLTPQEAVQSLLESVGDTRNPEVARDAKIAELREQIAKLQQVTIGLPPYQPNRELALVNIPRSNTLDVEGIAV